MTRRLIACSLLLMASACAKPAADTAANDAAPSNNATAAANTIEETGAPQGVGSYGPGLVATPVFVEQAAISDMFETDAAKVALERSKSDEVKGFAHDMITAHAATSAELKKIVADDKITAKLPTTLDPKHQRMVDDLKKEKPDGFDKLYLNQQQTAHREALGLMDSYLAHGDTPALKDFAGATKPKIQAHLDAASKLDHAGADEAGSAK